MITAINAITPDEQSGSADRFRNTPGLDADATISRDRSYVLAPTSTPQRDLRYISSTSPAVVSLELGLAVAYQNTRNCRDRILKDSERILETLEAFQSIYSGDILEVATGAGDIQPLDRTVIVEYVVTITYSLDLS